MGSISSGMGSMELDSEVPVCIMCEMTVSKDSAKRADRTVGKPELQSPETITPVSPVSLPLCCPQSSLPS